MQYIINIINNNLPQMTEIGVEFIVLEGDEISRDHVSSIGMGRKV